MNTGVISLQDANLIHAGQTAGAILQKHIFFFLASPSDCGRLWWMGIHWRHQGGEDCFLSLG